MGRVQTQSLFLRLSIHHTDIGCWRRIENPIRPRAEETEQRFFFLWTVLRSIGGDPQQKKILSGAKRKSVDQSLRNLIPTSPSPFPFPPGFNVGPRRQCCVVLSRVADFIATLIRGGRGGNQKWKLSFDHCWGNRNRVLGEPTPNRS